MAPWTSSHPQRESVTHAAPGCDVPMGGIHRHRTALCAAAILVLALCFSARVRADDATLERARQLYQEGEQHYRIGQFDKALQQYETALKLAARPNIMFNIGQCYRQLRQPAKALFYYKLFLSEWKRQHPQDPDPLVFREVHKHIVQLTAELRAREAQHRAREAEARWRERLRKEEQWRKEQFLLLKDLFKWRQQEQNQRLAEMKETLRRLEDRDRNRPGQISVAGVTVSGAQVALDGTPVAMAPMIHPLKVKSGEHHIRVTAAGYMPWNTRVTVSAGETVNVLVKLRRIPTRNKVWLGLSIASLALAAGAEATAIVFAERANGHFQGTDAFARDQAISNAGHVSAGVLGVAVVTTFVVYVLSHRFADQDPPTAAHYPAGSKSAMTVELFTF